MVTFGWPVTWLKTKKKKKKKKKTLYRLSNRHFYPLWFPFDSFSLHTLWNYKVPPWSDGANVALAEKLVQRADIHIYKHVILFAFMKFYFARLREKSILTNMWISFQCPHQPPKGYKRNCIFPSEVFFLTSGRHWEPQWLKCIFQLERDRKNYGEKIKLLSQRAFTSVILITSITPAYREINYVGSLCWKPFHMYVTWLRSQLPKCTAKT